MSSGAAAPRRAAATGFALAAEQNPGVATPGPTRLVGGIDTLLALQGIEDLGERRKRAARHGRRVLDTLDELKLGLLSGTLDAAVLTRLKGLAAELSLPSGDARLDQVLAEIGLRADVELAKAGIR